MLHSHGHPLLPLKPRPYPYPTRILTSLRFHVPTKGTFSGSGFPKRNFRVSPVLHSSPPQFSSFCVTSNAEDFNVELGRLLALLPEDMRRRVSEHPEFSDLIEVVMDLGRKPLARFPSGDFVLSDHPITMEDVQYATSQVSLVLYNVIILAYPFSLMEWICSTCLLALLGDLCAWFWCLVCLISCAIRLCDGASLFSCFLLLISSPISFYTVFIYCFCSSYFEVGSFSKIR